MSDFAKVVGGSVFVASFIFLVPILGVLFGAFAGWVVGLFFAETILGFLSRMGMDIAGLAMWQVGAALGFIGGFFKATLSTKGK